jgi:DNA-binding XRE family transcriptional regulator
MLDQTIERGRDLAIVRKNLKIDQKEAAKLLGWHPQTVVDFEAERFGVDRKTQGEIAEALENA